MSTITLTGARWSSAVRCPAKAEHEALNSPREENQPAWLDRAFSRGFHVGEAWAMIQASRLENAERELEVPWGPPEFGWRGHVDLADMNERVVYEAYHSKQHDFREEKALQAAGYAISLGADWRAVLVAIDATDVDADGGFAIKPYPVEVDGLRERVLDIQARVVTAAALGEYNPADRISDTPNHAECKACPFSHICHAGYVPPAPEEIVGLEDKFEELRITDSDLHHAEARIKDIKGRQKGLREQVREYLTPGIPVTSGDTTVIVREVSGRTTFSVTDYTKAGNQIPDSLLPFVKHGKGHERWDVTKVDA